MKRFALVYVCTLLPLLAMDAAWLTSTGKTFYGPRLAHLMNDGFRFGPAVFFYAIYAAAVTLLVVLPALRDGAGAGRALAYGALLGLAAYGAYDFTNHATLRDWPLSVTVVDLAWGTFVTAAASGISFYLSRLLPGQGAA